MKHKKTTGKLLTLVLSSAVALSIFTVPAFANGRKDTKSAKKDPAAGVLTSAAEASSASAPKPAVSNTARPAAVTLEAAKEIALRHAGADSGSAVFTKAKLDKAVYELKFSDETGKYEYEISASDGAILDFNWDIRTPAGTAAPGKEDGCAWEGAVSREQAGQIALDAAGVSRETLKYLTCYLSWSDHVPTAYEVKLATRWAAYHYTIDPDTGAILAGGCLPHA